MRSEEPTMKNMAFSGIDLATYGRLIQFAGRLSKLFSDSETPLIDYRFVEKAFVAVSKARDLSRKDISYDAAMSDKSGVGVKTFGFNLKTGTKIEKIAEFTKDAKNGAFAGLPPEAIATVVSDLRNARLKSDAAEVGISLDTSFYHCLLRVPGGVAVHEEEMLPIDEESIQPLGKNGKPMSRFSTANDDHVRFTDGNKEYTFNRSKNTLMQRFSTGVGFTSEEIPLSIQEDIWDLLLGGELDGIFGLDATPEEAEGLSVVDYVVLPLYSTKSSILKMVPEKSGINQWNAGGRQRTFGEAYIPIPGLIHKLKPGFFPPRDQKFELRLPSGEVVSAKVCQDGSKALMSDPNTVLCNWLFSTIDGSYSYAESRMPRRKPYTYDDLARVGKDSVVVRKLDENVFELEFAPVGSFEEFVDYSQDSDGE
jgi:hypothetical protein